MIPASSSSCCNCRLTCCSPACRFSVTDGASVLSSSCRNCRICSGDKELMLDNRWLNSDCVMATIQKSFNYTEFRAFHPYCRAQYIDVARLDHLRLLGFYVPGAGEGEGGWRWGLNSEWHSVFPVPSLFW